MTAYRVLLAPDEGPSFWTEVEADTPAEAREVARQEAWDEGDDASPIVVERVQ